MTLTDKEVGPAHRPATRYMLVQPPLPARELCDLDFLTHEYAGLGVIRQPGLPPLHVRVVTSGYWEEFERFLRVEVAATCDGETVLTWLFLVTYNSDLAGYDIWIFASHLPKPMVFFGRLENDRLEFESAPMATVLGSQKLRSSAVLDAKGRLHVESKYWTPDGYETYVVFDLDPVRNELD